MSQQQSQKGNAKSTPKQGNQGAKGTEQGANKPDQGGAKQGTAPQGGNKGNAQQGGNKGNTQQGGANKQGNVPPGGASKGGQQQGGKQGSKPGSPGNSKPGAKPNAGAAQQRPRQKLVAGFVRAVLSGDTVVVLPQQDPNSGPPKEVQLTLMGLRAPLLGKKTKSETTPDQPFAWESREFLRNLLVGKSIAYRIEHEFSSRNYGELFQGDVNIRNLLVSKGWADVNIREKKDKDGAPMELRKDDQEIAALLASAKTSKLGMWADPKTHAQHVRKVEYYENKPDTDPALLFKFFEKNKGKTLTGVVEQVRSGSTLKVYSHSAKAEFTVNLSGVHCPVFRFNDEESSKPFSREAKFFTEHCLLNRDVLVTLESMDKFNNYFGTVLDSVQKRNIATNLISMGLGSFVEWNAPQEHVKEWQSLEQQAKAAKLRIWKKHKPEAKPDSSAPGTISAKEFLGTVIEIINAGLILVRVQKADSVVDVNVTFSSIRLPRSLPAKKNEKVEAPKDVTTMSEKEKKDHKAKLVKAEEDRIQNAWAFQAKEFLRKELIGKKVKCVLDYVSSPYQPDKDSNKTLPGRPHYSVYVNNSNVALQLLRKGLATVSLHQESDPRSPDYKDFILSEKAAKQNNVGLHGPSSRAPSQHINDLTNEGEGKNRHFLGTLKRVGKVPAVVEYVFSAGRYKLLLPSQGLELIFSLQGVLSDKAVKTPKAEGSNQTTNYLSLYPLKDKEGNPIASNVALHYARDHLYQRDVEVQVDDIDKFGTFFGTLFLNRADFTSNLVELGHAKLHHRSAEKLPGYSRYTDLENKAKSAKKGLWWDYDEEKEKRKHEDYLKSREDRADDKGEKRAFEKMLVTVTEIMTGSTFFFQEASEEKQALITDLMSDFQSRDWQSRPVYSPEKKKEWVAAKFSADNNWYRAEVLRVIGEKEDKQFELRYVDYGNTEITTSKNIRGLTPEFVSDKFAAQAKRGKLAYVKAPILSDEFGEDAAVLFKELVWGKTLHAIVQYKDVNEGAEVWHVQLGDQEKQVNINGILVIEGLARVESRGQTRVADRDFYVQLQKEEEKAKHSRLCIWQYGAVPDSDEDRLWANMLR